MVWPFRKSAPVEQKSIANPDDWLRELFGATPSAAGVSVTPASAMSVPPVRCAVLGISETVGQLPVHLHDRTTRERIEGPLADLLNRRANEATSAGDLREQLIRDALLHGNGYAAIVRVDGEPREMLRLEPASIQVDADDYGLPTYRQVGDRQRVIARRDVFHLRGPGLDGVKGDSPVRQAREAIGLAILLERHASKLFANGARPAGWIGVPQDVPEEAYKSILAAWRKSNEGSDNSGKTAVLVNGSEFHSLTFNSVDAQFLELRQFAISEIARIYRIPPIFLQDYGRATWSNSAEMGQQFLTYCLMPWLRRWEAEVGLKLIEDPNAYAEFQTDALLRSNFTTRMAGYSTAIASRILNPNEARAAENRPPYEGGDEFINPNITTAAPAAGEESE